ncbi:hypothetical protein BOTBODRAFT_144610 [Botryobasidium botryosum FD-172 SS1]|uniref:Glycoside hydrolase family 105 protein n=1 Tax=Botryobasidium botryosum (strain FD-172 SS1) TaxID=930990 RepID=A0A067MPA3_BOTB1|nr:hypothetical protein BOTBODRAFT_144610 [Botryobasidium botryosum FD-172 SS1]
MGVVNAAPAASGGPTPFQISQIKSNLLRSASHSWELGTATQTLLEYDWAPLSVFSTDAIPPPNPLPSNLNAKNVWDITNRVMSQRDPNSPTLMQDGSAGDPASLGVAIALGYLTDSTSRRRSYGPAAQAQVYFLLNKVPRAPDGAISHRTEDVQLWSDSVYMVPPFLAYYGAVTKSRTVLNEAYTQIKLYRTHLLDVQKGVWRHVAEGQWHDDGLWATGNGWAAMGMLRVHQTISRSSFSQKMIREQGDLTLWARQILTGMIPYQQSNGAFCNYLDRPDTFIDSSSTALFAAAVYRLAAITPDTSKNLLPAAEKARRWVTSDLDNYGWLKNVVNPNSFGEKGSESPEGQAFVLMMEAAYRDLQAGGFQ